MRRRTRGPVEAGGRPGGRAGGRRPAPGAVATALLLVAGTAVACGESGAAYTGRPDDVPGRRLASAAWDTVFTAGGSARDTVFAEVTRIAADGDGVSVVDGYARRVLRFGRDGSRRWEFGRRGGGPDEFRHPRDLAVDARGRTWVLDVANARVTVLDAAGRPAFRIPLDRLERRAEALAPLPADRAALFVFDPEAPFVLVGRDGEPEARLPFPWPGLDGMSALATQMKLASGGAEGVWAAAFTFGDGLQLFDARGETGARGWLPEAVPFPGVEVRTSASGVGRSRRVTRMQRPRSGAVSVAMSDERLYVLFGGVGSRANRWVDSYSLDDGGYAGSYLLPRPVSAIAHGGGVIYGAYADPYPALGAWRPRGAPAP